MARPRSAVDHLVRQAMRRQLAVVAVDELCRAAAVVLLLLSVLLVTGAAIFHPAWVLGLAGAAVAWAGWRILRRRPDAYAVARRADAGLGLKDLLATAWSLRQGLAQATALAPLIADRAERACADADVRRAIPLRWSPAATAALAAFLLAAALFVARVGILRTFELQAPLVAVHFDTLTGAPVPPRPQPRPVPKKLDLPGFSLHDPAAAPDEEPFVAEALRTVDAQEAGAGEPSRALRQTAPARSRGQGEAPQGQPEPGGDPAGSETESASEGSPESSSQGGQAPAPKQDSLLERMRDALASLMDRFRLELPPGDGTRTASQPSSKQEAARREKGQPQPGRKGEQGQEGELQSGQPQAAESTQQARSDQAGRPDSSSPNEKSGVGREEGRKELEMAEQLEAMGKLDELIGRRSQNVQGEILVEVTHSKNQSLRTPFEPVTGRRADAGTDLGRDEVPLHLQPYVRRYYEQVRRTAPGGRQP